MIAGRFFNAYATLEALYGLSDQPLFMTPVLRVERGLAYLTSLQNADGGFPDFGSASSAGGTLDTLFAFVAAGYDPTQLTSSGGNTPLDYLAGVAATYTRDDSDLVFPGAIGKLIAGIVASGGDPTAFGTPSRNLVADLLGTLQADGSYSTAAQRGFASGAASVSNQTFAIFGLVAAGQTIPQSAIDFLAGLQAANGSWGSPDNTGLALQALIAAGVAPSDPVVQAGVAYLQTTQAAIGGWESFGAVNVNSTAYAIQGLLAAGVDLSGTDWLQNGRMPIAVLASYQKTDGPFVYNWNVDLESGFNPAEDSPSATQQALPVLRGAFYPYAAPAPLQPFTPLQRGPDPDRLVVAPLLVTLSPDGSQATLTAPFGSDLNGDATATLEWGIASAARQDVTYQPAAATRGPGFFQATIDLSGQQLGPTNSLVVRATFSDASDGVQAGDNSSNAPVVVSERNLPFQIYMPIVAH